MVSQDYGLGNTGADAASRNHIERVSKLCLAFGIRPIQCTVPGTVDQPIKDAASYAKQVHEAITKRPRTDDEQKTGRKYRNTECGDGPTAMRRLPKKTHTTLLRLHRYTVRQQCTGLQRKEQRVLLQIRRRTRGDLLFNKRAHCLSTARKFTGRRK